MTEELKCAICNQAFRELAFARNYPNLVCHTYDARALNAAGKPASFESAQDSGDKPVFFDGNRCWRRYRFGAYITMLDKFNYVVGASFTSGLEQFFRDSDFLILKCSHIARYMFLHSAICSTFSPCTGFDPDDFIKRRYINKNVVLPQKRLSAWARQHGRADRTSRGELSHCRR